MQRQYDCTEIGVKIFQWREKVVTLEILRVSRIVALVLPKL